MSNANARCQQGPPKQHQRHTQARPFRRGEGWNARLLWGSYVLGGGGTCDTARAFGIISPATSVTSVSQIVAHVTIFSPP